MISLSTRPVLVLAVLAAAACYRPQIGNGAFSCGPGGICPEGYTCNAAMLCVQPDDVLDLSFGGTSDGPTFSGLLGAVDLSGQSGILECSTKTGQIQLVNSGNTMPIIAAGASGFSVIGQTGGPPVGLWSFTSLTLPASISVKPAPDSDALPAFAAVGSITIDGLIDWRGFGGVGGSPGLAGNSLMSGAQSGGGSGFGVGGGGGGGYGATGLPGSGVGGGAGGAAYGAADVVPLHAGSGGGGAGGGGGDGAGGFALVSGGALTINGKITCAGLPGYAATATQGGGGGGSGGSIVLSGASVKLGPQHVIDATGGAGGDASSSGGQAGGAGAVGRVWIGGSLVVEGSAASNPPATEAGAPLTSFPTAPRELSDGGETSTDGG